MSFGEAFPARLDQRAAFGMTFGKKAKPLEHRAVAETRSIAEKRVIVSVCGCEIDRQAIGNMPDSAAQGRIIQHVDYRAMFYYRNYTELIQLRYTIIWAG